MLFTDTIHVNIELVLIAQLWSDGRTDGILYNVNFTDFM